ncbi:hypothetical protein LCGC14_1519620 [marine sediment metagenome]|uniref:HD domain-containing protein n=1 Tax=marine sediment metagenome TaxID=412755 RepID=A0A0F9JJV6_9ZZZZ
MTTIPEALAFIETWFLDTLEPDETIMHHIDDAEWQSLKQRLLRAPIDIKSCMESEAKKIQNPSLQLFVLDILNRLPEKAWHREASLVHHHADEQGDGGNALHEIRVTHVATFIAQVCDLEQLDKDLIRAASLLHDSCRHGLTATDRYSVKNHPQLVRTFIEENNIESDWIKPVCTIIDTHMARWGSPPYTPQIDLRDILILADFIVTQLTVQVDV